MTPLRVQRRPVTRVREDQFMEQLRDLMKATGWEFYHPYDSRKSNPGWPDLVLCRPPLLLFRELKTDTGQLKPEQREWLHRLKECGADVGVWRPKDLRGGRIAAELTRARRAS